MEPVTTASAPARRLYRRPDRGLAGGVATGIAEHLGISVKIVWAVFVVLATAGGLGIALYGAYLIVVPTAPDAGPGRFPAWLEYVAAGVAAVATVGIAATTFPANGLFLPALFACLGGALIWRQAAQPERARLRSHDAARQSTRHALAAAGWSMVIELAAGIAMGLVWLGGVLV